LLLQEEVQGVRADHLRQQLAQLPRSLDVTALTSPARPTAFHRFVLGDSNAVLYLVAWGQPDWRARCVRSCLPPRGVFAVREAISWPSSSLASRSPVRKPGSVRMPTDPTAALSRSRRSRRNGR